MDGCHGCLRNKMKSGCVAVHAKGSVVPGTLSPLSRRFREAFSGAGPQAPLEDCWVKEESYSLIRFAENLVRLEESPASWVWHKGLGSGPISTLLCLSEEFQSRRIAPGSLCGRGGRVLIRGQWRKRDNHAWVELLMKSCWDPASKRKCSCFWLQDFSQSYCYPRVWQTKAHRLNLTCCQLL